MNCKIDRVRLKKERLYERLTSNNLDMSEIRHIVSV